MKKRMICCALVLLICMSLGGVAYARRAFGNHTMTHTERTVYFSGQTNASYQADEISVLVRLMELRGSTWHEVSRISDSAKNSDYVHASGSYKVTGGYYYKAVGTFTYRNGAVSNSETLDSTTYWIS